MTNKTFQVSLDMKEPTAQRNEWEVVEGDNGNVIEITLTDGGEPVDLTGCKVLCVFGLPNGRTVEQDTDEGSVTVGGTDHNVITIALATGSFSPGKSASGLMKCEVQVYSGTDLDTLVTSAQFTFRCRRSIMNDETIRATDEYPVLVELIQTVQSFMRTSQSDWAETDSSELGYIRNKPASMAPTAHADSHRYGGSDALPTASTGTYGLAKLYDGVDSNSTGHAATAHAVKQAYDKANAAIPAAEKGAAGGVAMLDALGKVTAGQASAAYVSVTEDTALTNAHAGKALLVGADAVLTFGALDDGTEIEIWNTGSYTVTVSGALFVAGEGSKASCALDAYSVCAVKKMGGSLYVSGGVSV